MSLSKRFRFPPKVWHKKHCEVNRIKWKRLLMRWMHVAQANQYQYCTMLYFVKLIHGWFHSKLNACGLLNVKSNCNICIWNPFGLSIHFRHLFQTMEEVLQQLYTINQSISLKQFHSVSHYLLIKNSRLIWLEVTIKWESNVYESIANAHRMQYIIVQIFGYFIDWVILFCSYFG